MIWRIRCTLLVGSFLLFATASLAQEIPARMVYDIASVKPSAPGAPEGEVDPLPGGIGYDAKRISIKDMLSVMYRIPGRQIVGGPEWMSTEKFDVEARADRPYSIDDLHIMFQNLLADRFDLKLHQQVRVGPVYVLTVAKSGLKMTPVDPGIDRHNPIATSGDNVTTGDRVPLNYLCFWLGQNLQNDQRPVIDKTGLTGTYNFTMSFRPQLPPDVSAEGMSQDIQNLPGIFDAMKEQLGLELVPQKGPVEYLIIDHIEKPSAN